MSAVVVPTTMPQMPQLPIDPSDKNNITNPPGWGSYLYQNFVLPALTPNTAAVSEWLNLNTPLGYLTPRQEAAANAANANSGNPQVDYFGSEWNEDVASLLAQQVNTQSFNQQLPSRSQSLPMSLINPALPQQSGPSSFFPQPYFYNDSNSISTSLLLNAAVASSSSQQQQQPIAQSSGSQFNAPTFTAVENAPAQITRSPSPVTTTGGNTPHMSPKRGAKRRVASLDDEDSFSHVSDQDHEGEVPEGVERDGMIWGMKVEDYRALSARERKRVRNRISARTFRAKRKEHLSSLQESMNTKDLELKLANEETKRLRSEVQDLKNRLSKYES